MNAILRFFSIFIVTARRLIAQRGLALATTVGLVVGVAIAMSIPIYADAVYQRIFKAQVETGETGAQGRLAHPMLLCSGILGRGRDQSRWIVLPLLMLISQVR